ncbi:MAG: hypothetical protein ACUVWR_17520 [Anaerolineae bacterium]
MGNQERRIRTIERDQQALELRKAGVPYLEIAARLGWRSASTAHVAVTRALRRTLQEPADELRELEVARLDALLFAIWPQTSEGNLDAIDRALRIMERRAKLLGLDRPVEQKLDVSEALADVLERLAI